MTELTSAASETTAVLQGLAAGTLIYVVMFEVIPLWRGLKGPRTIFYTKYLIYVMFEVIPWRFYEPSPSYMPPVLLWPYLNPSYKMATYQ